MTRSATAAPDDESPERASPEEPDPERKTDREVPGRDDPFRQAGDDEARRDAEHGVGKPGCDRLKRRRIGFSAPGRREPVVIWNPAEPATAMHESSSIPCGTIEPGERLPGARLPLEAGEHAEHRPVRGEDVSGQKAEGESSGERRGSKPRCCW